MSTVRKENPKWKAMLNDGQESRSRKKVLTMDEQKKPRTRGKDKKPRRTDGYKRSCPKNLEKARANSPITQDQQKEMPEGYNRKLVSFMLAITPKEPLDPNDVEEMERRFLHYLEMCAEWDMKVGNQAAYLAIGINKDTAFEWSNRSLANPERTRFVKKVQHFCGMYREGLMQDGKVNPVTGIFWQKNYDGMKDQQEMVVTPNSPLGEQKTVEQLKQKYLESANIVELPEETPALELPESRNIEKEKT